MSIAANDDKTTEFSGNYTLNGSKRDNQAIYVDNSNATVTFSATDGGTIILNDKIDGSSGYNVVLSGDSTGTIGLYNSITNANIRANSTNIDLSDGNYLNYNFLSLASLDSAKYSIDVNFLNKSADKFTLGSESRGTILINDLNLVGGAPTTAQTIQILTGPDTISIGLTEDLINKFHKITVNDRGESDELTQTAKWGTTFGAHLYKDTIEEGIRTAISGSGRESADSLEYYINTSTEDLGVVPGGDTMMLMNQSDKFASRTFSANNSSDTYTVGANLGKTYGTFNVNGYSSSTPNVLDADGHTLFEIGDGATVNLKYLTINNLADVDGSLMKIELGGTGTLNYVNVNGNDSSAAIVNDGTLNLGYSSNPQTFTGGGIKGNGTTNISWYWDFAQGTSIIQDTINIKGDDTALKIFADDLQGNINVTSNYIDSGLHLKGGTLNSAISGSGKVYINGDTTLNADITTGNIELQNGANLTTNADHLKTRLTLDRPYDYISSTTHSILTLTGGTLTQSTAGRLYESGKNYYLDTVITGDVTVGDSGKLATYGLDIKDGASLTTKADNLSWSSASTNNGTLNLTDGDLDNATLSGTGITNILGDVTFENTYSISQDTMHIKEGATLHTSGGALGTIKNFINDSVLDLTGNAIRENKVTAINGKGKTQVSGRTEAYYTDFNQDLEILEGGTLKATWDKNFTNIKNDGTLNLFIYYETNKTSSTAHGTWAHNITGSGLTEFEGHSWNLYLDNQAKIDTDLNILGATHLWSNADLLGGDITISTSNYHTGEGNASLTLTGGTINHQITGKGSFYSKYLYIDEGVDIISNAIISCTDTSNYFLQLKNKSSLTISADNLDASASLASDAELILKSGTWNDKVSGGTVTILSSNEVQHHETNGTGKTISSAVVVEDGAKFTASASNLRGTVTNDGEIYLSGVLNRKYDGTGTTYIDDTLTVSTSNAGFPGTFDLNEGTLISESIASYTFGHTTNNGGLIFNVNAAGGDNASDNFTLGATSDAVFDIQDIVFGTYKTPSFANSVHTYQILKGSPSYLTLGETMHKDIDIYDSWRDQLGSNIYQDDPENRYFDDKYVTHHTSGTVDADITLWTKDNNHDGVQVTYGDYHSNDYETRLDLLADWNAYSTEKVRNFNFKTADDVYTSVSDVGTTSYKAGDGAILNINGVSTTTTDADGNTVIKRSVIDLDGHSGFDMSNSNNKNVMNIYNVEFRNGNGRVISAYYDTFGELLEDGTIQGGIVNSAINNTSTDNGGALYLNSTNTIVHQILNSTFKGNTTIYTNGPKIGGSAIHSSGIISNITSSSFISNFSYNGGAIYNNGTISNITSSSFISNFSYNGGAIYNNGTISNITSSTFENNTADSSGTIYNTSTIDNITGSNFENNSSSSGGGAIRNSGTISNIAGSTFENNTASYGGAVYNTKTISNITGSNFDNNSASTSGGAIYNSSGTITNITGTTFENNSSSSFGGAIYNDDTISEIANTTFENNSSSSFGGAIYNSGTISEILNSRFINNLVTRSGNSYGGAIYNSGTMTIAARGSVDEDGNITEGLTEFTGNYSGSELTDSNNYAIYSSNSLTLKAEDHGTILMNDKIYMGNQANLNLTGNSTGTIKLFDTITQGIINATGDVNITTANSKTQNYALNGISSEESVKWSIDVDFANNKADTFTVRSGTGTMYIDNLNVMSNTDSYKKVEVLTKNRETSTQLVLKDAVVDVRDTIGDTVYNTDKFHQEAGYAVASSYTWNSSTYGYNNQISQCIDEELSALNLITVSDKNQVRNFVFNNGDTYTLTQDLDQMYKGTINIKGLEGDTITSTIDANGHSLFKNPNDTDNITLNISDVHITGTDDVITMSGGYDPNTSYQSKVLKTINLSNSIIDGNIVNTKNSYSRDADYLQLNFSGRENTLNGAVGGTIAKLNSGDLHIAPDTFADHKSRVIINGGTLALNNGKTETYNIYNLQVPNTGNLSIDIDLNNKISDQIDIGLAWNQTINVSDINFINGIPENGKFKVQVLKNQDTSMPLALTLDESIKHYVFDEYSAVLPDEIKIDTDFGHEYFNRLYTGSAYGDLELARTQSTNDSIVIDIKADWDDETTIVDSMGDTLYLVNNSELSTRNFNSSNAKDVYNESVNLDKTAQGNLVINGTLGENDNHSTINFKNHDAFQIGDNTNLTINNARLTGNRNLISVDSSSANLTLNNAYINGNILGSEKYNMTIDGTDTTTIVGSITNANVNLNNGGLVISENTFADDSASLVVKENAYVHLNDDEISNYKFSNISSSNLSKFGLDLDLETRQADSITAEGSGRIVFEKFDIVNDRLSNVDIGEDYTIQILHTSNDSLQLAISETVQAQLEKEYKLGTVHEIIRQDSVVPVADWKTKWAVEEGDYDVYGKLKLATTITTNDSLHLYELRKNLTNVHTDLGDTLMLMSILDTNQDRRFYTESVDTYSLSTDIGDVTAGKMSLEGTADGENLSIIDMGEHQGFKLSKETEMSASNIKFANAGYKDGSLFNITNSAAVLNLDNVTISDTTSTNAVKNAGTVNMTGGNILLFSGISGTGVTNINGGANVTLAEGLSFTQDSVNVNNGYLLLETDSLILCDLTVGTDGIAKMATNSITTATLNDGHLIFTGGTLEQNINGSGTTDIVGEVINNATIDQNVDVQSGEFTTSADNIGGTINNNAITNLTGTLKNTITGNGTTNVNESLTLASGAGIVGTLNLNDGKISTSDKSVYNYKIGTMLNEGTFDIDIDLANKTSDLFDVGNDSKGLVYIETVNFLNSQILQEGESFEVQVLETHGTDAIQIALNEALKADRVAIGTISDMDNDLRAVVSFNEKFHDTGKTGTVYATLAETTIKTTNDGIKLSFSGIEWDEPGEFERVDTLKELAQYNTDEDKEFNFETAQDKYTVLEDLGEATDGTLNINGVSDGEDKSEIDINDHTGFELTNDTVLNITDVEIGGAKDDKIIVATNPDAIVNITNGTINGDIDGTDTAINISGDENDTTILNGEITNSDTTLDGGTLQFNPATFADEDDTLTINKGRVDVQDDKVDTYGINKLTSSEEGRYSVDVDLETKTADKFEITDKTSSGTVYIDTINYINGELPEEFKAQILDTNGNDDIQIKLSDEIKNKVYDFGTTQKTWDDLANNVNFDESFHDFTQIGDIKGSIKEATTDTINDSIELVKNDPIWRDEIDSQDRLDTLHEIAAFAGKEGGDDGQDKSFNFKSADNTYASKADVGVVKNALTVNGVTDGENRSKINLSGKAGFELEAETVLNLKDVEIGQGKDNTLISAIESGSTVNIKNNTLNGNIEGFDTIINITGDESDTTTLNGTITSSDTTLNGGTLKFNTDTFADKDDTLTVNNGRVDVKDSSVNTYDIQKLTSSDNGKYSIDVDLETETADKFNLTDTTSSGTVYIDDINYLNGGDPKEFIAQVLDTKGNDNIQIKLSDEIKSQTYDLGTTERNSNDLKDSIYFDEKFHDIHQDGIIKGAITEATNKTTNDSIALKVTGTEWGEVQSTERVDTLHELAIFEGKSEENAQGQDKNFNFKTASDEYNSTVDVGTVKNTLTVNGVSDETGNKSTVNLNEKSGFALETDSTLNLNDVEIDNGSNNNIIVATQTGAKINIENSNLNGNINGYDTKINITGDESDTTVLNGTISNSDTVLNGGTLKFNTDTFADKDDTFTVNGGRIDVKDKNVNTYDITKLTSSEDAKYSIDVDLNTETADKFNLTDKTSSGTVYIDDINYLNGGDPKEFIAQVLDTKGNNDIQIKLSDEIKKETYDLGTTEKNWDDLVDSINFDEFFNDYHQEGTIKGKITEDTTVTTNDSIALKVTETQWGEVKSDKRTDTLHEIAEFTGKGEENAQGQNKNFNFKTATNEYTSKDNVGVVKNTLTINGVSDGEQRSTINLNDKSGFELESGTILNLYNTEIKQGKDNNLISAIESGSTVNIKNNIINGNITGKDTAVNINGNDKDITILNGRITDSDTTLNGGTLRINTDTFADNSDTLTVNGGRLDVQDKAINTYDITKLTSSENGRYSIDIDLTSQTADKFNISDKNSSGKVYIDDIKYLNGELPTEFIAQILNTKGNNNIQIKLSDEIKNKIYDFGTTTKDWDDLKNNVDFDEIFHDLHQEGVLQGSIKEATTNTTNDSIQLKMDAPVWGEIQSTDRLDTLHEIAVFTGKENGTQETNGLIKNFNFKTADNEYESKTDVGTVQNTLSINGVKDSTKLSKINLKGYQGFELIKDSKLNVNNTRISNGANNVLITAADSSAAVTLNNAAVDGDIIGIEGYKVNITGDKDHIFDLRSNIKNANVNIDTIRMDVYNTNSLATSNVLINSGLLNMTADRQVSDLSAKSFTINGTFNMWADADLQAQTMDKLPSNTTIVKDANLNVAGINLLSDTLAASVEIPFAYKGFKDNVKYTGSSELSKETQITTAYAPIYKYDIRYDNRDDMGYFVFSRHGAAGGGSNSGGNSADSYNPAILASPVATQAAGQSSMNEAFRYVFEHADAFTQLPAMDRLSAIKANEYALSTDYNHNLGSLCTEHNNKAGWFRPYSTFETIDFQNGPKVHTINYGSLAGFDSDFHRLKHGWTNVSTGYVGYNGSQIHYNGVSSTMNGGLIGLTETFYKGNFWTAITASAGAGVAETHTMYGKEDSTMLMAGIGSKTGYNFEFEQGKYIVQPIMFMSYTFVNTFDYTNAAGVKINNDPMHTIQIHPSMRFIANTKNGWQPYASVGMVWNLMNETGSTANGVTLPQMHSKPYVEYGLGVQKNMKDRFTAFGQAMVRNGGRTGIALTAGFRWALGDPHDHHNHVHQKEQVKAPTEIKTPAKTRTVIKQLPAQKQAKLKNSNKTTITKNNGIFKEL
ncbi:MAG: hypothetical protein NC191_05740 [Muribaculaceae bacterium]|nr:hypothetical protein [Muribaculaceae bacterium]